jgi:hypothetical protein
MDDESISLVEDFVLTHTQGFQLPEQNVYYKVKNVAENINNSDAYTSDADLELILPSGLSEVEFNIGIVNTSSDTPDFKTRWSLTGCAEVTYKTCQGPARTITDGDDSTMQAKRETLTTGVGYGVTSEQINITEKAIIEVTASTGTVTLQRGQYTANASNTTVTAKSYVIARKIN